MNFNDFHDNMSELSQQMYKQEGKIISDLILECIEIVEGRVPSDKEVIVHGRALYDPHKDITKFQWKELSLFRVYPMRLKDGKFEMQIERYVPPDEYDEEF